MASRASRSSSQSTPISQAVVGVIAWFLSIYIPLHLQYVRCCAFISIHPWGICLIARTGNCHPRSREMECRDTLSQASVAITDSPVLSAVGIGATNCCSVWRNSITCDLLGAKDLWSHLEAINEFPRQGCHGGWMGSEDPWSIYLSTSVGSQGSWLPGHFQWDLSHIVVSWSHWFPSRHCVGRRVM